MASRKPPSKDNPKDPKNRGRAKGFTENRLLATLPRKEYEKLLPLMDRVYLGLREIVYRRNEPIEYVYFPVDGLISLITVMADGSAVEVGTVGNEGMAGIPVFLGAVSMPGQAFCQVPGACLRMEAKAFRRVIAEDGVFRDLIQRYLQVLFNQIAQSTACNRLHPTGQRFARWVLMTHDRVGADTFPLTQEFLSLMLGVRRATISEIAGKLQKKGIITYSRGSMTVSDRRRLEATSCECYGVIREEFDRLLGMA
jgi:CRP-like cAMP-binding protein